MQSNFTPAQCRGIEDHALFAGASKKDYIGAMFHDDPIDGAYADVVTWEGLSIPVEHFPMERVNLDGVKPSFSVRYLARAWTLGVVIPFEDQQDDLYGIIHKFFPMTGGEFGRAYYALKQILGAQFFGLYGFASGTSVPFSPDGLSFGNTAHPMSKDNTAETWSNTLSTAADLSIGTATIMRNAIRTQKRPDGNSFMDSPLARVMCHTQEEFTAKLIFNYAKERYDTANRSKNLLAEEGVEVIVNPYFEYSGTLGAASAPVAYNRVVGQAQDHYCRWRPRKDLQMYTRADNEIFADIITSMERFCYGLDSALGTFFIQGL